MCTIYVYLICCLMHITWAYDIVDDVRNLRFQVYANPIVPYGKVTPVAITMNKIPNYQVQLRLGSRTYLLSYCIIGKDAPKFPLTFKKCDNISDELRELGIVPDIHVDYENGYIATVKAIFWNFEDNVLKLEGKVPDRPNVHKVEVTYNFSIQKPEMCVPQIKIMNCNDKDLPMKVVDVRSSAVNVVFLEMCSIIKPYLTWSLYDLEQRGKLEQSLIENR